MGKPKSTGLKILIVFMILSIAGLGAWHVASYNKEIKRMKAAITDLEDTVKTSIDRLSAKNPDEFIKAVAVLNNTWKSIESIEASRLRTISQGTWLQRSFGGSVHKDWEQDVRSRVEQAYIKLPSQISQQTQSLVENLENTASRTTNQEAMRSAALAFRMNFNGLKGLATETAEVARRHSIANIEVEQSITRNKKAQEIDRWLDIAFKAEARILKKSQEAVNIGIQAANVTYRLGKDAPSSEIHQAVELWRRAYRTADSALNDKGFNPGTPPDYIVRILRPLLQSTYTRAEGITSDINRSLMKVEASYRQAVSDESNIFTGFARNIRRGVRTVGSNLMELGAAASKNLDGLSRKLADQLQEGMSNTMTAAAIVAERGIQLYQESKKSDLQRFIESSEGQFVLLGGLGLIVLISILGGLASRK